MKILSKKTGEVMATLSPRELEIFFKENGLNKDDYVIEESSADATRRCLQFLEDTDWQILRHREQVEMNEETSLTPEQYQTLLTERKKARDKVDPSDVRAKYLT
ncbi:hypothetical protein EYS14_03335 [Alteromonadaceae bacterium M269]|nr:hypothetical protein EYS14_03335 [Alteromonadaceae bacterium M269]